MPYRSPARFLAPLALVTAFIAVYAVVRPVADESPEAPTQTTAPKTTSTAAAAEKPARTTYTVKPGDVLSSIAESTGVALERIVELNPDLDPQSLRAGQTIKLTP